MHASSRIRRARRLASRDGWGIAGPCRFSGRRRYRKTEDQEYLGTNLGDTLTEKRYEAGGELRRASLGQDVAGRRWRSTRGTAFRGCRSGTGNRLSGTGVSGRTPPRSISGQALGGYRWFRLEADSAGDTSIWYADINATLNVSPKTKLGAIYLHDLDYTAFASTGASPTLAREQLTVFFDKMLASNVYLYLFGRLIQYNAEDIVLVPPGGGPVETYRDDRVREAGVELGYQFRSRVRMGVSAIYTERRSNIETFGIQGLLAGFRMTYDPPQPVVR